MNLRKRKEITKSPSSKNYKRRKSEELTNSETSDSDSTSLSTSCSGILVGQSDFLSIPDKYRAFVELLYQVRCESKYLINHITPIVLCCQYQNPIRCAYRLLHKNLEEVNFLTSDDLRKKERTAQIRKVASNLTDSVITLVRILKAVKTIQEKLYTINRPLQKFELYVTHMKLILNFVVHDLLNTTLTIYKSSCYTPSPFSFRRLECRCCKKYVTFVGCHCTRWTYDTVPSQIIQNQLLSPAEDGPMPSNKLYISDWDYLKQHVYKITTPKRNNKGNPKLKEPALNISRKQSKPRTRPCIAKNSLDFSKHVFAKSIPNLKSSFKRSERLTKIRRKSVNF